MTDKNLGYGIRLAIIYCIVWFIDLLDSSILNVTLPTISDYFQVNATNAEWAIVGFLLSMTIGISISGWLGDRYGTRRMFLLSQIVYLGSSLGCGAAYDLSMLIIFRVLQGFAAGLAIPLGLAALMRAMPAAHWSTTIACMNIVTLVAPATGLIFGAYVASLLGWRWMFFLKLPLSIICLALSFYWVQKEARKEQMKFDWLGFAFGSLSLLGILWVFSQVGKSSHIFLILIAILSLILGGLFIRFEKKVHKPLIPLSIFKISHFSFGNLIQSAANTIFLGASFLIALYLQQGLGLDLVTTGWVMAAITPGMIAVQPLVGRFYNRLGPLPFIIPGLIALSIMTWAFAFTSPHTSPFLLALLVFGIGAASAITQTANVTAIFSSLPHEFKGTGSSLYSLFKQISASFGVALSTMILSLGMYVNGSAPIPSTTIFHYCFVILGTIPALSLLFCLFINNQTAIKQIVEPNA